MHLINKLSVRGGILLTEIAQPGFPEYLKNHPSLGLLYSNFLFLTDKIMNMKLKKDNTLEKSIINEFANSPFSAFNYKQIAKRLRIKKRSCWENTDSQPHCKFI